MNKIATFIKSDTTAGVLLVIDYLSSFTSGIIGYIILRVSRKGSDYNQQNLY